MFTTAASPFRPRLELEEILCPADRRLFLEVADRTSAVFDRLNRQPRAWGIIHADFILANCQLTRLARGWDVSVLDFDDCGWGY